MHIKTESYKRIETLKLDIDNKKRIHEPSVKKSAAAQHK